MEIKEVFSQVKLWSLSLTATVLFAITHAMIHIAFSKKIQAFLRKHEWFVQNYTLVSNGIASIISLLLFRQAENWLSRKNIIKSVFIDVSGIAIGTLLVYYVHSYYLQKLTQKTHDPTLRKLYNTTSLDSI